MRLLLQNILSKIAISIAIVIAVAIVGDNNNNAITCTCTAAAYTPAPSKVLIIGGTRFSGVSLWKELHDRGHDVTIYNRGKTVLKPLGKCGNHVENEWNFENRIKCTKFIQGDRQDPDKIRQRINPNEYEYVYDMNARTVEDTKPLAELFVGSSTLKQYIFMSSAGVYLKSDELPHRESDPVDPKSRHSGKLDSEQCLQELRLPWCSFRPTYICGPGNYNPIERYFFERLDINRPICIPGHGQHLTGFGHVYDLAVAMSNCIGRESVTSGKVYNCQNTQAITFDGVVQIASKVIKKGTGTNNNNYNNNDSNNNDNNDDNEPMIIHFDPKEYDFPKDAKAFPMRPQHFFTSSIRAMEDLQWKPVYDTVESIFRDSYENDYLAVKESGKLKGDFLCDDIILERFFNNMNVASQRW